MLFIFMKSCVKVVIFCYLVSLYLQIKFDYVPHRLTRLKKSSYTECKFILCINSLGKGGMLGTMYPNYSSFSANYLLPRVIPKVPAGAWIGQCMWWHMPTAA